MTLFCRRNFRIPKKKSENWIKRISDTLLDEVLTHPMIEEINEGNGYESTDCADGKDSQPIERQKDPREDEKRD